MRDSKLISPEKIQETLARALNPDLLKDMINEQRLQKMEKQDDDQEEEEKASQEVLSIEKSQFSSNQGDSLRYESLRHENLLTEEIEIHKNVAAFDALSHPVLKQKLIQLIEDNILPLDENQRSIKSY